MNLTLVLIINPILQGHTSNPHGDFDLNLTLSKGVDVTKIGGKKILATTPFALPLIHNLFTQLKSFIDILRNHDLFDWKTKPKIKHFDIWSVWSFNYTEQVNLKMSNLIDGFFYWS